MSNAAALAAELLEKPMPAFCRALIKIDDADDGQLIPFRINDAQLPVFHEIRRQETAKRPVRILILKGRQQGMSTFCQAFIAWKLLTHPGVRVSVVGHELGAVGDLYGKLETMIDELPAWFGAQIVAPRKEGRRLTLNNGSRVRFDSAHRPGKVGRGGTRQILHLTEGPQWADEDESMQAVLATVREVYGTYVFVETTAKGASGWFYEQFSDGMEALERGIEPNFVPVFVPWFKTREYARPYRRGEKRLSPEERAFKAKYGLTTEQVLWYRDRRKEFGDKVVEEYPSNWREAFMHSGSPWLRPDARERLREFRREPDKQGSFIKAKGGWLLEKRAMGPTHIFHAPIPGHRYSVGVDFASGQAADRSAIVVIDWDSENGGAEVVATHVSKMSPEAVLHEAWLLARAYNRAIIVPDRNGIGYSLVQTLAETLEYTDRIYVEADEIAVKYHGGARLGFATSSRTRPSLMYEAAHLIHLNGVEIPCERLVTELCQMVYVDNERVEAPQGKTDDMAMAYAYAVRGRSQLAEAEEPKAAAPKATISSRTGY